MVHPENANKLANSLRAMNFPVFVDQMSSKQFHYVLVGPYSGVDAAHNVKNDLEKRGFQVMIKKWKLTSQ